MALIAHWPLNGNLDDYSGFGNHLVYYNNSGKIITETNGKIGQARKRAGLNDGADWLGSTNDVNLQGDFSMAVWAYVTSAGTSANGLFTNHNHSSNTGAGITVFHASSTDFRISCNTGTGTGRTYNTHYGTSNIKDRWAHLALRFIKETNTLSLWVDGVKEKEIIYNQYNISQKIGLFSWSLGHNGNTSYRPGTILNDARVYDHALSTFELKELAKAKILHYTFDDMQEPTTNVAALTLTSHTPYHSISRSGQNITMVTSATNTYLTIQNGVAYTPSTLAFSGIMKLNGVPHALPGTKASTYQSASASTWYFDNETGYFEIVQTFNNSSTWLFHTHMGNTAVGDVLTIENFQVEQKDHVTEFTPISRTGQVNDYSGFFNHSDPLTETTTPQWIPEAKIGSGAYKLNGNNYFLIHKYNASNDASLSLWFKSDLPTSTSQVVIGSPSSISFGIHNNTIIGMATTSAPVGLLSGSPYTVGQWNHIVITRDVSNVMSYYINGIKISNGSNNVWSWNDDPYGIIGRRTLGNTGSAYYTNGEIDDVRIYATTLSDEDILGLYRSRVSFDNKGNVFNYHIEQENLDPDQTIPNKFEVKSTGSINPTTINQIDHNLNQETTKQRLKEDGTLEIDGYIIQN